MRGDLKVGKLGKAEQRRLHHWSVVPGRLRPTRVPLVLLSVPASPRLPLTPVLAVLAVLHATLLPYSVSLRPGPRHCRAAARFHQYGNIEATKVWRCCLHTVVCIVRKPARLLILDSFAFNFPSCNAPHSAGSLMPYVPTVQPFSHVMHLTSTCEPRSARRRPLLPPDRH
jgi:hypothetical protein